MKKNILIKALGSDLWIGGLYYIRNIVYELLSNDYISTHYHIIIYTEKENEFIFSDFNGQCSILHYGIYFAKSRILDILFTVILNKIEYAFPFDRKLDFIRAKAISWIPDFQHKHFPEYFSKEDCKKKDRMNSKIEKNGGLLVLSSYDALNDYNRYYFKGKTHIEVVHFVSYIEPIIKSLNPKIERKISDKFELSDMRYICIMNQFWQHKNHLVVLNAIKILIKKATYTNIKFVFTGKLDDYRNQEYISQVKKLFEDDEIEKHTVLLGFIDRMEQISIMKNAEFIIQPSLFEGWGTVVEDAKVLDKTILLSDIPVHREQMNEKCILFDPHNPEELAALIQQECHKEHHDNIEKGIADMKKRALEYSKGFEQLLRDQEKNR